MVVDNQTVEFNKKNDYYRSICSDLMKKILGNKFYYKILKILMNPNDTIIESNHSYSVGNKCKGYRMSEKYNTGETEFKDLPKSLYRRMALLHGYVGCRLTVLGIPNLENRFKQPALT